MTYRITWEGTESDLQKLVEAHIQHGGNGDTLNSIFGNVVREKLIEAHLNLGGQLKNVTIKIEHGSNID